MAAQEYRLTAGGQDRHSLVVGREGAAEVEAEQALLDQDEHHGLDRRQHEEHRAEISGEMRAEQRPLPRPAPAGRPHEATDTGYMQAERLEEKHRDEQVRLVAEDKPLQAPSRPRLGRREGEDAERDVRIGALGVRVRMMAAVLAVP